MDIIILQKITIIIIVCYRQTYEGLRQYINSIVPLLGLTNVAHQKVTISLV